MLSKMGGKMMFYQADNLTDMLLDSILGEVAIEMQQIEKMQRNAEVASDGQ